VSLNLFCFPSFPDEVPPDKYESLKSESVEKLRHYNCQNASVFLACLYFKVLFPSPFSSYVTPLPAKYHVHHPASTDEFSRSVPLRSWETNTFSFTSI